MTADQREKFKHILEPIDIKNYNLERKKAKLTRDKTVQREQQKVIKEWTKMQEQARRMKGHVAED